MMNSWRAAIAVALLGLGAMAACAGVPADDGGGGASEVPDEAELGSVRDGSVEAHVEAHVGMPEGARTTLDDDVASYASCDAGDARFHQELVALRWEQAPPIDAPRIVEGLPALEMQNLTDEKLEVVVQWYVSRDHVPVPNREVRVTLAPAETFEVAALRGAQLAGLSRRYPAIVHATAYVTPERGLRQTEISMPLYVRSTADAGVFEVFGEEVMHTQVGPELVREIAPAAASQGVVAGVSDAASAVRGVLAPGESLDELLEKGGLSR
jgi:hypothetical protein